MWLYLLLVLLMLGLALALWWGFQKNNESIRLREENARKVEEYAQKDLDLQQAQNGLGALTNERDTFRLSLQESRVRLEQRVEECAQKDVDLLNLHNNLETLTGERDALRLSLQDCQVRLEHSQDLDKNVKLYFENLSNRLLEEQSQKFTQHNRQQVETLLKPLNDSIDGFRKKVEENLQEETKQRSSLESQVKHLVEQTNKVSQEANNLASALKGEAKTMGNWGEMILENILQQSGLRKGAEYEVQASFADEESDRLLRPDVLVHLPDQRTIIVDSKVSLKAYEQYFSAESKEQQLYFLEEHLKSLRQHIQNLSEKHYDNLPTSLDFTMLFVPIEPAYLLAIQSDPQLWSKAYEKRILLISPTNLIACLKLIADLWKRELQSKNAMEIVLQGEKMYDKFVGFVESLKSVGDGLNRTQDSYNKALSQLKDGRGNLIGQAEKLKALGLKSEKRLPEAYLGDAES